MTVPFFDLTRQHAEIGEEIRAAIDPVVDSQRFVLGEPVERLEAAIAELCGTRHAIGVASGTDALLLPLMLLDLQPGDEVITSPFTFFATAGAIHNAGGTPVFADIDPQTFNLDPAAAEAAITDRTRAIVPVHLYGQIAEMERFREIADRHGLFLLEDAAQAIGARRRVDGKSVSPGGIGDAAAFSFFPTKNLGGYGDGGMVVTSDDELAERLFKLRVHGGRQMYHHEVVGTNSRLDAIQAAVLLAKLPHLERLQAARHEHARAYHDGFASLEGGGLRRPVPRRDDVHAYNQYTVRTGRRDALRAHLDAKGVGSNVYYPVPLHLQACFADLGYAEGDLPEAESASRDVLSLPIFPELEADERDRVIDEVKGFHAG